jgi:hypothetical protein
MKRITIPITKTKDELFDFLKKNKSSLVAEKKLFGKLGEAVSYACPIFDKKENSFKAATTINTSELLNKDELLVKVVINTTNLLDSHCDVHMKGLWKKSLKESGKSVLHLQTHKEGFEYIIADGMDGEIKAYVQTMSWKELGFNYKGDTEALVFESVVKKARNPFMFDQYAKGYVKFHSVGMGYVKVLMCINSEEKYYREEKENWDAYYDEVANKEAADERGYFWAVTEGKVIEGSAVVRGSNFVTPTLEVKSEPGNHSTETEETPEPVKSTLINYDYLTKNFKLN